MKNYVKGKRILISGGTDGIGKGIAMSLLGAGGKVFIFSRHKDKLDSALRELKDFGKVFGVIADVSSSEEVKFIFALVDEKFKGLDIMINNAGLPGGSVSSETLKNTEYISRTNLGGYLYCAKEAIVRMKDGGHIINIGSLSAVTKEAGSSAYVATKSGVQGFSTALRKEVGEKNIKVTLIEPGAVATSIHDLPAKTLVDLFSKNEMLEVEDVSQAVLFALNQPQRVDVITIQIKPRAQNI